MSLTNPNKPVTEARLQEFYHRIKSYLGFTEMPSEDMNEVISPLPSVQPRYHKYSTEEHIVGEWIDGKPIYEKTIQSTVPTVASGATADELTNLTSLNIDALIMCQGVSKTLESVPTVGYSSTQAKYVGCIQCFYNNSNKNLYVRNIGMVNDSAKTIHVTIQYTKSE